MAKIQVPKAEKVDNDTVMPKPSGTDALAEHAKKHAPSPEEKVRKSQSLNAEKAIPEAVVVAPEPEPVPEKPVEPLKKREMIQPSKPVQDDTVLVTCMENASYRYGRKWLLLVKGKKVSLPLEAAKAYRAKGKVDY